MERIVFVGPGKVALCLGSALAEASAELELVYHGRQETAPHHTLFHRRRASYRAGLELPSEGTNVVLLTVPDDALPEIAAALAARGDAPTGCVALHTSGALGADPLEPLHTRGYAVGTLHPLRSVATPHLPPEALREAAFAISGEPGALYAAARIVHLVGGFALKVPTHRRPLYHAAAVLASNYLVVLLHEAVRWMEAAGASREEAERALSLLARGAIENVLEHGVERALTGPLVRGDVETVALHLRTLSPQDAALYAALGAAALRWVGERLPGDAAQQLEELFQRTP